MLARVSEPWFTARTEASRDEVFSEIHGLADDFIDDDVERTLGTVRRLRSTLLRADRQALAERASVLARAEQVLATLQEQLRRRSEEFAGRQQALDEQARRDEAARAEVEARRAEIEHERSQGDDHLAALGRELETGRAELEQQRQNLTARESEFRADVGELAQARQRLEAETTSVAADRSRLDAAAIKELAHMLAESVDPKAAIEVGGEFTARFAGEKPDWLPGVRRLMADCALQLGGACVPNGIGMMESSGVFVSISRALKGGSALSR